MFLTRDRPITARIRLLAHLDGLWHFRDQYVHGAGEINEDDQLALWICGNWSRFPSGKRFSEAPGLQIVIKAAPPPTE